MTEATIERLPGFVRQANIKLEVARDFTIQSQTEAELAAEELRAIKTLAKKVEEARKAEKETWFYVVGCDPRDQPELPLVLGEASHVVQSRKREDYRPHITKAEREHTPPELAAWLVSLARRCKRKDSSHG